MQFRKICPLIRGTKKYERAFREASKISIQTLYIVFHLETKKPTLRVCKKFVPKIILFVKISLNGYLYFHSIQMQLSLPT